MATPTELARLAAATNLLRPDWQTKSLQTYLEHHHTDRPIHDLAVALTWIATDPTTKTPARLSEAGPWWTCLNTSTTPRLERFNAHEWHTSYIAGAVPPPTDFADRVEAARAAPAEPPAAPAPGDNERRAEVRRELARVREQQSGRTPVVVNEQETT